MRLYDSNKDVFAESLAELITCVLCLLILIFVWVLLGECRKSGYSVYPGGSLKYDTQRSDGPYVAGFGAGLLSGFVGEGYEAPGYAESGVNAKLVHDEYSSDLNAVLADTAGYDNLGYASNPMMNMGPVKVASTVA